MSLDSSDTLEKQLKRFGGGLEIETWSKLPVGSGLGTSSILGGAILSAIGVAVGFRYDTLSLIHAVLHLEQTLTTGGGWQDQVGGFVPGMKSYRCLAGLPLTLKPESVDMPETFYSELNRHFVLLYTGRTRLGA